MGGGFGLIIWEFIDNTHQCVLVELDIKPHKIFDLTVSTSG